MNEIKTTTYELAVTTMNIETGVKIEIIRETEDHMLYRDWSALLTFAMSFSRTVFWSIKLKALSASQRPNLLAAMPVSAQ